MGLHNTRPITPAEELEIVEAKRAGATRPDLLKRYGIGSRRLSDILIRHDVPLDMRARRTTGYSYASAEDVAFVAPYRAQARAYEQRERLRLEEDGQR